MRSQAVHIYAVRTVTMTTALLVGQTTLHCGWTPITPESCHYPPVMTNEQKVIIESRVATHEEVSDAKRKAEDEAWHHEAHTGDATAEARFARMMEDIHKLAASPHADALRISTFSGVVPPPKNEASFSQWVHEVKDAMGRFPEATVRN